MTPLIIIKLKVMLPTAEREKIMETVADGIRKGALVIAGDCEILAFDSEGRLTYPIREVEP